MAENVCLGWACERAMLDGLACVRQAFNQLRLVGSNCVLMFVFGDKQVKDSDCDGKEKRKWKTSSEMVDSSVRSFSGTGGLRIPIWERASRVRLHNRVVSPPDMCAVSRVVRALEKDTERLETGERTHRLRAKWGISTVTCA